MTTPDLTLPEALLDSWDRNNVILVNLLRAIPETGLAARAAENSPSVSQMFHHMHYVRLVFLEEDTPDFAQPVPNGEWEPKQDPATLSQLLNESAAAVRAAVKNRIETGRPTELHYDHPILLLQHMIWHEGYHHGQIKLALKLAGQPLSDDLAGPLTWGIWMRKTTAS